MYMRASVQLQPPDGSAVIFVQETAMSVFVVVKVFEIS